MSDRLSNGSAKIRMPAWTDHVLVREGRTVRLSTEPIWLQSPKYRMTAEMNLLRLIPPGNANRQIADQLSVAEETVKGRIKNILPRIGGPMTGRRRRRSPGKRNH